MLSEQQTTTDEWQQQQKRTPAWHRHVRINRCYMFQGGVETRPAQCFLFLHLWHSILNQLPVHFLKPKCMLQCETSWVIDRRAWEEHFFISVVHFCVSLLIMSCVSLLLVFMSGPRVLLLTFEFLFVTDLLCWMQRGAVCCVPHTHTLLLFQLSGDVCVLYMCMVWF